MKHHLTRVAVAVCVFTAACNAYADSQLDRLESATTTISDKTRALFEAQAPELAELLPDPTWDAPMRDAMSCYLGEIERIVGKEAAEKYLDEYEAFAQREFNDLKTLLDAPAPLPDREMLQANDTCGVIELSQKRMEESGYTKVFSDPDLMKKLTELMGKAD
ncbi:hypothetical protein GCM10008090_17120 [Arenicella chitinivorans]|uniref:Uncharacterized protein n=1 Tax=Arenicella chitinivorans TaxID=1329800 RepID=A0A918VLV5_9GAMM|nr:hypothetical protein [Arenicella chitinivorans]GHA07869.1 hypothetical protein GCM10008090_17120 [Arenicella chitinivorans]